MKKIISKKFEKPLDKSRQVWYTIIAVSESKAVKEFARASKRIEKNFKIFQNLLTNGIRYDII